MTALGSHIFNFGRTQMFSFFISLYGSDVARPPKAIWFISIWFISELKKK